jgi:septum formation protein
MHKYPRRIILASASPRRQELLRSMGFRFRVKKLNVNEDSWPEGLQSQDIALHLAKKKIDAYDELLTTTELLITADTIVWCEGKIYNKPADTAEAAEMLKALSGKMHEVFTAVCLKTPKQESSFYDTTRVYFKEFTDEEIEYYIETCKPFDKAGSYGVQEWIGYIGIEKIEGSFYNVMGLPVKKLYEELLRIAE